MVLPAPNPSWEGAFESRREDWGEEEKEDEEKKEEEEEEKEKKRREQWERWRGVPWMPVVSALLRAWS